MRCLPACGTLLAPCAAGQSLSFEGWDPRWTLVVEEHRMDALNLAMLVDLSGGRGARLRATVEAFKGRHPGRFAVFANPDFRRIGIPGWPQRAARQLEDDVRAGARGLKIFKNFGMGVRDRRGARVPVDDPAMDPLFRTSARLDIPELIHVADTAEFCSAHDSHNER